MLSFTMQAGPDPVQGPFAGLADSDGSLSPIGVDAWGRIRAWRSLVQERYTRRFSWPRCLQRLWSRKTTPVRRTFSPRQRAHSRALRSCVRMTATASTSKPATSAISTPIVWLRTLLGCGTAGRYRPAIDNDHSCMRRSDTPPPAWTIRYRRRKTSGTTSPTSRHTRSSWGTRSTVPAGAVGARAAHTGGTGRIHHDRSQPGHGTSVRSGARGHARHARRRDPLVPHGRRRTRSALRSTAPASEPFVDPGWTLRAGIPEVVNQMIARTTIEILILRPTMSYGLTPARE